jgi:hypothetical protein
LLHRRVTDERREQCTLRGLLRLLRLLRLLLRRPLLLRRILAWRILRRVLTGRILTRRVLLRVLPVRLAVRRRLLLLLRRPIGRRAPTDLTAGGERSEDDEAALSSKPARLSHDEDPSIRG